MSASLVFVVGTRAQLIKVAPVVVECERQGLPSILLMTGQHQETMQDLINEFGINSPQVHAFPAAEHATVSSLLRWLPAAYRGIRARLREIGSFSGKLIVLVHGDTLSTLVGAFAARRHKARVVHLESGLSSGRLFDPFPEEICRRLVFRMTDIAMCPNSQAVDYMCRRHRARVVNTVGNTIVDAVALSGASAVQQNSDQPYLVVSLHRFQNLYDAKRLSFLVTLIESISESYKVYFVLHPATRGRLEKSGLMQRLLSAPGVHLSPRMGYKDFLHLAAGSACVLTDGGSNQEELAVLGVPTIVMRARTERPDGLGVNAMMETDLPGGVQKFILDGLFKSLQGGSSSDGSQGPSSRIVASLSEVAS